MLIRHYIVAGIIVGMLMLMFAAVPAMAQEAEHCSFVGSLDTDATSADFTGQQIGLFAQTQIKLDALHAKWKKKIDAAAAKVETAADMTDVMVYRANYTDAMTRAIKDGGLTLCQYNAILQAAGKHPDLAKRIEQARAAQ